MDLGELRERDQLSDDFEDDYSDHSESVDALAGYLRAARRAVVFTGAGISTESGIPDFRSPGGYWTKNKPIDFGEFISSAEARREAWRRRFAGEDMYASAKPNAGHLAISELVRRGLVTDVITQNIDNLHQESGVPPEKVIELHGNTRYAKCLRCGAHSPLEPIREYFEAHGDPPGCSFCGGLMKTGTVSFGEPMPREAMMRAETATRACDLFIVLGSSLVVQPAASFPAVAKKNRAKLVIINRDQTPLDMLADLLIQADIGPLMRDAVSSL
ncbi:MAG TPA: Sir2 family NAD-dependent protein deacetylase [Rhizomicrobium sp.]|nr:Sir2 family NAD-dependent protein deacetylase [Rhizomicrobium sp.]